VQGARAMGFRGFNLTIPHKVAVIEYLDAISPEAAIIGAVNTVRREDNAFIGENTDGKGFLRGLRQDAQVDPAGKRVVVLGAGGAARAIATELALAAAGSITVVNRSVERGKAMTAHLRENVQTRIEFVQWQGTYRVSDDVDILVNATSIGLFPDVASPDVDLSAARAVVCDAVFNPPVTGLLRQASERGLPVLDGLSMLVYQGVIGFEMWTGSKAPEKVMKEALRRTLLGDAAGQGPS
jgi:shikimate dehydrogenase